MAILSISFDKTGFQKCFEGKTGFIVPIFSTNPPMLIVYKAIIVNIGPRSKSTTAAITFTVFLTVLPRTCQESNNTFSQTLCGLYDKLSPFFFFLRTFHPFTLTGSNVWIRVMISCINITVNPWGGFISPGLDTINHLGPK